MMRGQGCSLSCAAHRACAIWFMALWLWPLQSIGGKQTSSTASLVTIVTKNSRTGRAAKPTLALQPSKAPGQCCQQTSNMQVCVITTLWQTLTTHTETWHHHRPHWKMHVLAQVQLALA
jgi:hypothetical protein